MEHKSIARGGLSWLRRPTPCNEAEDPDMWFSESVRKQQEAKAGCSACPLQRECLREALVEDEGWGIWGGMTTEERQMLLERLAPPVLMKKVTAA